jgi:hypothetical protein
LPESRYAARWENFQKGTLGDWVKYLDDRQLTLPAANWPERASFHNAGDNAAANLNVGLAWSPDIVSGGRFVLFNPSNSAGCNSWSSEDGTQWTFEVLLNAAAVNNPCVAYGRINGGAVAGFVATWVNPTGLYTSTDGIAWGTVVTTVPGNGVACYSPSLGLWVIAGDAGVIYTSPTTLAGSWTVRTTPAAWIAGCGGVKRVVFANGLFVILPLGAYNKVLTSPDGITWTERALTLTSVWTGLAYSAADGLWMASSTGVNGATSPDGITWTGSTSFPASNDLAVNGVVWVVGTASALGGGIAYSTDKGLTWSFAAVGNHRVATSGWSRIISAIANANARFMTGHVTGAANEVALSLRSI